MKLTTGLLSFLYFFSISIGNAQNVGIGKSSPLHTLDVQGIINADSSYYVGGHRILRSTMYGSLFIGDSAGAKMDQYTSAFNVFVGSKAGAKNISGSANTFFGFRSGYANDADYNSFFGNESGYSNSTGSYNAFLGYGTGGHNSTQQMNTFLGYLAGNAFNSTGSFNTVAGALSGNGSFIGDHNTFIGYDVDPVVNNIFQLNNSTAIGHQSRISASNQMRFGNGNITSIGGYVDWTNLSDGRFKTNIKEDVKGLAFINKLRPVTYSIDMAKLNSYLYPEDSSSTRNSTKDKIVYTGFIAQEVENAAKETGYEFSGVDAPKNNNDVYGLRYASFTVPLVKAVQELAKENEALRKEMVEIKAQLKK